MNKQPTNVTPVIKELRGNGKDFTEISDEFNKRGWKTKKGKPWSVHNIRYVYYLGIAASSGGGKKPKRISSGGKPKSDPGAIDLILKLNGSGNSPALIVEALKEGGFKTATGVDWTKDNVRKLIQVYRAKRASGGKRKSKANGHSKDAMTPGMRAAVERGRASNGHAKALRVARQIAATNRKIKQNAKQQSWTPDSPEKNLSWPAGMKVLRHELSGIFARFDKIGLKIGGIRRGAGGKIEVEYTRTETESFALEQIEGLD